MRVFYIIFIIVTTLAHIICFYYILLFCSIYPYTSPGWAISSIICILFKLVITQLIGPLSGLLIRKTINDSKKYANNLTIYLASCTESTLFFVKYVNFYLGYKIIKSLIIIYINYMVEKANLDLVKGLIRQVSNPTAS
jgi:hypothetical protein